MTRKCVLNIALAFQISFYSQVQLFNIHWYQAMKQVFDFNNSNGISSRIFIVLLILNSNCKNSNSKIHDNEKKLIANAPKQLKNSLEEKSHKQTKKKHFN